MNSKKSFFFIKPEGIMFLDAIQKKITKEGLAIVDTKPVRLDVGTLLRLFGREPTKMIQAVKIGLRGELVEMGVVEGDDAIQRLASVCGKHENPSQCSNGSIRKTYTSDTHVLVGSRTYYRNAIYYSRTESDAKRDLDIFQSFG